MVFSEFFHNWTQTVAEKYIYLATGILLSTVCVYLLYKYAILDPLDDGIVINETAVIMNEAFPD